MKLKSLLVILALCLLHLSGYSQIEYEGIYSDKLKSFKLENGESKYASYFKSDKSIKLYNFDRSEWKTVQLTVPKKYAFDELKSISVYVFNADTLVELAYTCARVRSNADIETTSNNVDIRYTLFIVNESGEMVFEAENGNNMELVDLNGSRKLMVYKQSGLGSYKKEHIELYSLPAHNASLSRSKPESENKNYTSDHIRGI